MVRLLRQLLFEDFNQRGAVAVQQVDEADRALLRMPVREGLRARADELAPQRVILALRGLDDLAVQRLQFVRHLADGGFHRAFQYRIDAGHHRGERAHALADHALRLVERRFDRRRQLRFEQAVQGRFVLPLQLFEWKIVPREEPTRTGVENRSTRALTNQRHRYIKVLIDAAQLSEVRQLARAADVGHGG